MSNIVHLAQSSKFSEEGSTFHNASIGKTCVLVMFSTALSVPCIHVRRRIS